MDNAFTYMMKNGIPKEEAYPYTARTGKCAKFTSEYKNLSFTDVPKGDPA